MDSKKFIRCTDKVTIEQLKKLGFQLVSESNGIATFINDITKPIIFEEKKIAFTDKLVI